MVDRWGSWRCYRWAVPPIDVSREAGVRHERWRSSFGNRAGRGDCGPRGWDCACAYRQGAAEVVSGELPEIDAERRQQQYKLTDEERERKANDLESQLEMGRKYGTLTPEHRSSTWTRLPASTQSQSSRSLLQRIHKAIHPTDTVRQAAQPLPNAIPEGGTAAADEAEKEKELGPGWSLRSQATRRIGSRTNRL